MKCAEQLLWVGSLEENGEYALKMQKGFDQTSAQLAQKGIINEIEKIRNSIFDSINGSVVNSYPIYKDKKVKRVVWAHHNNSKDVSVGFRNIKYISKLICKWQMIREANTWIKNRYLPNCSLTIFVYSLRSAPMETAMYIKKRIPSAKIVLIITDLPKFMDLGESRVKKLLKKIDYSNIQRMVPDFDKFVLYSEKMAEYLSIPNDKWILMEGFYSLGTDDIDIILETSTKKTLFYAGMLSLQYGIDLLIESFMTIENPDIELWLAGSGNAVEYIEKCQKRDGRIKYFGLITREEVLAYQQRATCLINMRLPTNEVSAYSFPSKIFEYLASGKPVLSFKLEGIPKEYYDYLVCVKSEDDLAEVIQEVFELSSDTLKVMGEKGRKFVLENKVAEIQVKKICDFVWGKI